MTRLLDGYLRYFAEVIRNGTLQAASENLNLASSLVSQQVAQLYDALNLLERGQIHQDTLGPRVGSAWWILVGRPVDRSAGDRRPNSYPATKAARRRRLTLLC